MCKSLIFANLIFALKSYAEKVLFLKKKVVNAKKVLNFIHSLINQNKVTRPLTTFHSRPPLKFTTFKILVISKIPQVYTYLEEIFLSMKITIRSRK